jgi:hypothetical protein
MLATFRHARAAVEPARREERLARHREPERRRQVDAGATPRTPPGPTRSADARSSRRRCSRGRRGAPRSAASASSAAASRTSSGRYANADRSCA